MEDIGDIKAMRKNLMIVSLSVLALIFFAGDIHEINLGLVKFKEGAIFGIKNILLLIAILSYALWRYWQYLRNSNELRHWDMRNFGIYLIQEALKRKVDVTGSMALGSRRHFGKITAMGDDGNYVFIQGEGSGFSFEGLRRNAKLKCSVSLKGEWKNDEITDITWEDRFGYHETDNIRIFFGNENDDGEINSDEVDNCEFVFECKTPFLGVKKWMSFVAHIRFWDYILPILLGCLGIISLITKLLLTI